MRKWILLILLLVVPNVGYSQVFNLFYNYKEVCSEQLRQVKLEINLNSPTTLAFFGYYRTFTTEEIQKDDHVLWLNEIYEKWKQYYPCAEISETITEASRNSSKSADIDINKPIVIVSSDLGYKSGNIFKTSAGYNQTNLLNQTSNGVLFNVGTNKVGNIGYFIIKPINNNLKSITNINLLFIENNIITNYTTGVFGSKGKLGSYFGLHAITFGKLNGYPFQDNSFLIGYSNGILNTRKIILSTNVILNYTYRIKVFTLDYWFEDYIGISPYLNFGYKITPTFALNLSYTTSLRTDMNTSDRFSILLGGRVLF